MPITHEIIKFCTDSHEKLITELQTSTDVTIHLDRYIYEFDTANDLLSSLCNELKNSNKLTSLLLSTSIDDSWDEGDNISLGLQERFLYTLSHIVQIFPDLDNKITKFSLKFYFDEPDENKLLVTKALQILSQHIPHLTQLKEITLEIINDGDEIKELNVFNNFVYLLNNIANPNQLTTLSFNLENILTNKTTRVESFNAQAYQSIETITHEDQMFLNFLNQCTMIRSFKLTGNYLGHYTQDCVGTLQQHQHLESVELNCTYANPEFYAINAILNNQNLTSLSFSLFRNNCFDPNYGENNKQEILSPILNGKYQRNRRLLEQLLTFGERIQQHTNLRTCDIHIAFEDKRSGGFLHNLLLHPISRNKTITSLSFNLLSARYEDVEALISSFKENRQLQEISVEGISEEHIMKFRKITERNKRNYGMVVRLGNQLIKDKASEDYISAKTDVLQHTPKQLQLMDYTLLLACSLHLKRFNSSFDKNQPLTAAFLTKMLSMISSKIDIEVAYPKIISYLNVHDLYALQKAKPSQGFFAKLLPPQELTQNHDAEDAQASSAKRSRPG